MERKCQMFVVKRAQRKTKQSFLLPLPSLLLCALSCLCTRLISLGLCAAVPIALYHLTFSHLCFFNTGLHARTTRVLLFMVLPGNLIFLYTIRVLQAGHTTLTLIFTSVYLLAGLIQVRQSLKTFTFLIPNSSTS